MARRWHYSGDVNLEYGGTFFDLSEWSNGYVTAVQVTDLDSATGFSGAFLIEERSIPVDYKDRWETCLDVIGASLLPNGDINDNGHAILKGTLAWRLCLSNAMGAYGLYDTHRSVVVQPDRSQPTEFDGWHAERIRSNGFRSFVRKEFLGLSR